MPAPECPECERLFREYAEAVQELHRLQRQHTDAAMTFDVPQSRSLQLEIQRTFKRRGETAARLLEHQERHKKIRAARLRTPTVH